MYLALAQIARWFLAPAGQPATGALPRQLMERAGARAGHNPRQARELRRAARAMLSVVR